MRGSDLEQALISYADSGCYPFHMPGHKRQKLSGYAPEQIDITEIEGFDDLHHAEGILRDGQERLAKLCGAAKSFYLINGSTAGILAAICASVKKGGRILMGRNCHKSVYHGAYLMELKTEYLYPEKTEFGIQGSITPAGVKKQLEAFPDTQAVLVTSPTYDGVASDIEEIAGIAHAKKIPLIVDAAHGAHFGFSTEFPQKAVALGADLSIESLHKTLPAYTQTAALHVGKDALIDMERLVRYLDIFQSSSPSYVLMAGAERCVRMIRQDGKALFAAFGERLRSFYRACEGLSRVKVFPYENRDRGVWKRDVSKILISAGDAGLCGQELYEILLEKYRLQMEMVAGHYVTALTSIMDTDEGFARLTAALREIDASAGAAKAGGDRILAPDALYVPRQKKLEIFEALDAPVRSLLLPESVGRVSAEFAYLYPPGIPLIAPGEVISEELPGLIAGCGERGMQVRGLRDPQAERIATVKPREDTKPDIDSVRISPYNG